MKNYILAAVLIIAVASCSKKTASTSSAVTDGVTLFSQNCAKCHGANGVEGKAPKLNQPMKDTDVISYIANGHGKMPAFKDKLSSKQIEAITKVVLQLQKKNQGK